jgi:hypothetical protein
MLTLGLVAAWIPAQKALAVNPDDPAARGVREIGKPACYFARKTGASREGMRPLCVAKEKKVCLDG